MHVDEAEGVEWYIPDVISVSNLAHPNNPTMDYV